MNEDEKLHDEAEEIRKETAEERPSLPSTTAWPSSSGNSRRRNSKALYAAAETQNIRRRLERRLQQATSYAAAGFARDMLAIKDHLERALDGGH